MHNFTDPMQKISAIDLFCGVGGLTFGLEKAGIPVTLGVDIESRCAHALEENSNAKFLCEDVVELSCETLMEHFPSGKFKLLAGCAPCQPFSTYSRAAKQKHGDKAGDNRSEDWRLLSHFGRLIREVKPDLVTMENVPPLATQPVFKDFLDCLEDYWLDWRVIECQKIGLPQSRKRLVLVASRLGPIDIPEFSLPQKTVRDTIGKLPKIEAGETCSSDPLHRSSRLSPLNMERIRHSKPGGSWRDWPDELRAKCHSKSTGATYPSVYGRMMWDAPAPTVTTQCFGYGNGRFGHPEQDRAISLREAAMLQGFPRDYSFLPGDTNASFSTLGRMIGNAVPVTLGEVIGELFQEHVRQI
ncbi:DNA cytosine methyltransferase [Pseudophaeobacter sp.]|uniref:DNA cytosine methyltransferase n=1 Tax=Pseudophaeobacter sp. TaxID=1971739 RepID=UPI004059EE0C